jgi:hypothetical protein
MTPDKIPHAPATHKIYFTREYTWFKNIHGNRLLNESKINRIIKDIKAGLDILKYCPIIVDREMNVIDGQHRLFVAKKLKSNIWYVISDNLSLHEIAKINSNTERWKAKDFIHCYSIQGNKHYKDLENFMDTHNIPLGPALLLLRNGTTMSGGAGLTVKDEFESGRFQVKQLQKATEVVDMVKQFKKHPGFLKRGFIDAVCKLMEGGKCDFEHLLKKFTGNPDALRECPDTKTYLKAIEDVYNIGQKQRKVIY